MRIREGAIDYAHHDDVDPIRPRAASIANRMERTWAIDPWLELWRQNPAAAPKVLIGLSGDPADRYILGAIDLSTVNWPKPTGRQRETHEIPWAKLGKHADDSDIDAFELRGRTFEGVRFQLGVNSVKFYDSAGDVVSRERVIQI